MDCVIFGSWALNKEHSTMLCSQREGGGTGKGGMHANVKGEFQVQF